MLSNIQTVIDKLCEPRTRKDFKRAIHKPESALTDIERSTRNSLVVRLEGLFNNWGSETLHYKQAAAWRILQLAQLTGLSPTQVVDNLDDARLLCFAHMRHTVLYTLDE